MDPVLQGILAALPSLITLLGTLFGGGSTNPSGYQFTSYGPENTRNVNPYTDQTMSMLQQLLGMPGAGGTTTTQNNSQRNMTPPAANSPANSQALLSMLKSLSGRV